MFLPPSQSGPETPDASTLGVELESFLDALADALPEFIPTYLSLVEEGDDHPGGPVVLIELAHFVAERLALGEADRPVVERALALVETLVDASTISDVTPETVSQAFLASFSPEERRRLVPGLGPHALVALDGLQGNPDENGPVRD